VEFRNHKKNGAKLHNALAGNTIMKKIIFLMLFATLGWQYTQAQSFTVGGLNYNVTSSSTVEVGRNPYAAGNVTISAQVTYNGNDYSVTKISNDAFRITPGPNFPSSQNLKLSGIIIPNSVTTIGSGAFSQCTGLVSVTIPNSVQSIGNGAFFSCIRLTVVTLNSTTPVSINASVFSSTNISSATLNVPAGSESAYKAALVWKDFYSILESGSGTVEAGQTFAVDGINYVVRKSSMPYEVAVANNSTIVELATIPSIVSNGGNSFAVTSIGNYGFGGCTSLTAVNLTNSITSIGSSAFSGCTGLSSIILPNLLTSIGSSAFSTCTALTSVIIPNSVTSIGSSAFMFCSGLTSITIPSSVTSIGSSAFEYCNNLRSVICNVVHPLKISSNVFFIPRIVSSLCSLTVPAESVAAYQAADYWRSFSPITCANPSTTVTTFAQIAPICEGTVITALPTTSLEGVTGTWWPPVNNRTTRVYTFTPTGELCPSSLMTIMVVKLEYGQFDQYDPICAGSTLELPTTSLTGITGTWSPAFNNLATTTYAFTPDGAQCPNNYVTIVVNPLVPPTFTQVNSICLGETLTDLPTTSIEGIAGTWFPALNPAETTTYTFTPDAGQCAATASMTITVNPIVTPTFTPVNSICLGETLTDLPTTSNNEITGTWSPALNSAATSNYMFTPNPGQCATTASMTITVNPIVTPTFTPVATICSGETLTDLPTTSLEEIIGTWSPALNNTITTTYKFTPDAGQCAASASMTIAVTTTPPPTGLSNQVYSGLATLADLSVTGTAIKWYDGASGGSALPISTTLVDGTTYYASQTLESCESGRTAVTVKADNIPSTMSFCAGAKVSAAVGTSTLKFYLAATGGSALVTTTLLTTTTYYATITLKGIESTPREAVAITVHALPGTISTLTASDIVLCKYIGTTNTVTYTATPGATTYNWTVPAGVTIIGVDDTNVLTVDFHTATTSGAGSLGSIGVKAVNASDCESAIAKTIALSTKLPTAPSKVTLSYNGVIQTKVGNYVGDATKTLVLEATDISNTSNTYTWELPAGVGVVSGNPATDKTISIHLGGVVAGNTNLVFKAYSVAGCGTSNARSLVVTRTAPAAPTTLALTNDAISPTTKITVVSAYTGKFKTTPLTLAATPSTTAGTEATSFKWVLPSGIGIVDASATFVSENSGFKTYTSVTNIIKINLSGVGSTTSLLLKVYGVNGNGESLLTRNLTLTSAIPAKPGRLTTVSGGTATYHPTCGTITVKVPTVFGVAYTWSVKDGAVATVLSTNSDGNEAIIAVSKLPSVVNSSFKIGVVASNGTGSSETIYTIKLGTACSSIKKESQELAENVAYVFNVIAYPNPSSNVFTIKIQSLENAKSELSVYDSIGRLIDQLQVQTNELELGSRYPAGIYNLIVKQGENVKTVRVVKQ
jgi:hypothetical protein